MDKTLFNDLKASIREGGRIMRGEAKPSRRFVYLEPDVKAIRHQLQLTQSEFAVLLGVGIGTLRHWEQGMRHPTGAARVLLRIAERNPKVIVDSMRHEGLFADSKKGRGEPKPAMAANG